MECVWILCGFDGSDVFCNYMAVRATITQQIKEEDSFILLLMASSYEICCEM